MLVLFQSARLVSIIASSFHTDHGLYWDFGGGADAKNLPLKVGLTQRGGSVAPEEVSSWSSGNSKHSRCLWFCCWWNLRLLEPRTVDFPSWCWRVDVIKKRTVIGFLLVVLLRRHGGSKEGWLSRNLFNNLILVLSVIFLGGQCLGSRLGMILKAWLR